LKPLEEAPVRNAVALLIVFAFAAAPLAGQPPGEAFSPKGGRFAVRFPGRPKETHHATKTAVGELTVYTATYATPAGAVYLVSHTDFPAAAGTPAERATLFDGVRDGLTGKDGKVVAEKEIAVGPDKVPGREITIDKGKQQTRFRVAVKDARLYQVAVAGTGEFVTGADATAFLDSFAFAR